MKNKMAMVNSGAIRGSGPGRGYCLEGFMEGCQKALGPQF
jgi:hypothetical protein